VGLTAGTGALATSSLVSGCERDVERSTGGTSPERLSEILPRHIPRTVVEPDIPAVNGSDPGYLSYPAEEIRTVTQAPGAGGRYTAITPLWGAIPRSTGNRYYQAVNTALGAELTVKPANGNTYDQVLPTLFSGDRLPDWIDIPSWNTVNLNFGRAVAAKFADLTPFLAGARIQAYPNLANVPTNAWQAGVWNGRLFGIPVYPSNVVLAGALYYRRDVFDARGLDEPRSAEDLFELGRALTSPRNEVWAFDDLWTYLAQPFGIPNTWTIDSTGKLVHKYETPQMLQAIEFMRRIVAAGMVHPDAVAGNTNDRTQRFASGRVVVFGDGTGAWGPLVEQQEQAGDRRFRMMAMTPFTASGKGRPTCALGNGASMFSYLNRRLGRSRIEECLRLADYLAAPFGSAEYTLVNYGRWGVTYTKGADGPRLTPVGRREVATSYQFLATAPSVTARPGYPQWVRDYCAWQAKAAGYARKPVFYGMNITEPPRYAAIGQAVEDAITDVNRNRKPIGAFTRAVATWRRNGGEALRDFYSDVRDRYGTGQ
jgi:putative aldouronate transport system substrate-binding protein